MAFLQPAQHRQLLLHLVLAMLCLGISPASYAKSLLAPTTSYEEAYQQSPIIFNVNPVAFDAIAGVTVEVTQVIRGAAHLGQQFNIARSNQTMQFKSEKPFTIFVSSANNKEITLWRGANQGGVIWNCCFILDAIETAFKSPKSAWKRPKSKRERLSAAYYRSLQEETFLQELSTEETKKLTKIIIWGLSCPDLTTNQTALDILTILGIELTALNSQYHPKLKPELKAKIAHELDESLNASLKQAQP